jgi:hypothetical protein
MLDAEATARYEEPPAVKVLPLPSDFIAGWFIALPQVAPSPRHNGITEDGKNPL